MLNCTVCNVRIPAYSKADTCSDKCRQRKSRNKRMAQSKAYAMGFQVDQWGKMLSDGTITHSEAKELLHAVWDRLGDFYRQIEKAEELAATKGTGKV